MLGTLLLIPLASLAQDDFYALPDLEVVGAAGMRDIVSRYTTDLRALRRFWDVSDSPERRRQERLFFVAWDAGLEALDFDALEQGDQVDCLLLENALDYQLRRLGLQEEKWEQIRELMPFALRIAELQESRRRLEPIEPGELATLLAEMAEEIGEIRERVQAAGEEEEEGEKAEESSDPAPIVVEKVVANRAAGSIRDIRNSLESWFEYYDGYDPLFSWWCAEPYADVDEALGGYAKFLREDVAGIAEDDRDTILGDPIGRAALITELRRELIPYTPEELIEIANREFDWCDREMLRAAHDLGFGEDWRAAIEHVKDLHVQPGEQPELIRMLAQEAVDFLEANELVTVPAFARNVWRMEMMSPQRQKYTPYFTGGEVVSVSFPTDTMAHEDKLMSMRGNNVHFSRAVVHHELIPGHHLQQFMTSRYATHRRTFGTPFWGEGWALYWEMLLWDKGFPETAEDRVGMLFWRRHRCARIIFSLQFQLGEWTPEECIDFLMERVGHERANATAEVRRSVQGGYGPLYQAAYMLGGLQFRALHEELVGSGRMTDRQFHDAILREGSIPVELVRARLIGQPLSRDFATTWKFYEGIGK
jgi:hypothetical protein